MNIKYVSFIDLKGTMIQIYEAENKKTLFDCKDRKIYENQVMLF